MVKDFMDGYGQGGGMALATAQLQEVPWPGIADVGPPKKKLASKDMVSPSLMEATQRHLLI